MAHLDRISMDDIHGVYIQNTPTTFLRTQARALELVLLPRETTRRYASMAQKRLSELLYERSGYVKYPYKKGTRSCHEPMPAGYVI